MVIPFSRIAELIVSLAATKGGTGYEDLALGGEAGGGNFLVTIEVEAEG